jgi:hypothetical protein
MVELFQASIEAPDWDLARLRLIPGSLPAPHGYCAFEKPLPLNDLFRNGKVVGLTGLIWGTGLVPEWSTLAPKGHKRRELQEKSKISLPGNTRSFTLPQVPGFRHVVIVAGLIATDVYPAGEPLILLTFPYFTSFARWYQDDMSRPSPADKGAKARPKSSRRFVPPEALYPDQIPAYLFHVLSTMLLMGVWKFIPELIERPRLEQLEVSLADLARRVQLRGEDEDAGVLTRSGSLLSTNDLRSRLIYVLDYPEPLRL